MNDKPITNDEASRHFHEVETTPARKKFRLLTPRQAKAKAFRGAIRLEAGSPIVAQARAASRRGW